MVKKITKKEGHKRNCKKCNKKRDKIVVRKHNKKGQKSEIEKNLQ